MHEISITISKIFARMCEWAKWSRGGNGDDESEGSCFAEKREWEREGKKRRVRQLENMQNIKYNLGSK